MCLSNVSFVVPANLAASSRFTQTIRRLSSTALYVVATDPLPSNSADALISCSRLYSCVSPAQNTRFPLFPIAIPCCSFLTFSSNSFVSSILITSAAASAAAAISIISLVDIISFLFFFSDVLSDISTHIIEEISTSTPAEKPIISANLLCFLELEFVTSVTPFCICALCPNTTRGGGVNVDVTVEFLPKNGPMILHSVRTISPQSPGLDQNEDAANFARERVTGIGPGSKSMKGRDRGGNDTSEGVVVQKQGFEVNESGKIRYGPSERVALQTQDS
ncbi:hypothetical protein LXL04_008093 [Taraxacum kok-saghyz]